MTFLWLRHWFLVMIFFGNWAAMPLAHIMLELQLHVTYLDGHLYSTACKLSSCPAAMQICWNRGNCSHKKRVELPQDWFGTPTRTPFHCFETPIWLPWRHLHTLYCYLKHFPLYASTKHKTNIEWLFSSKRKEMATREQPCLSSAIWLNNFCFFLSWCLETSSFPLPLLYMTLSLQLPVQVAAAIGSLTQDQCFIWNTEHFILTGITLCRLLALDQIKSLNLKNYLFLSAIWLLERANQVYIHLRVGLECSIS